MSASRNGRLALDSRSDLSTWLAHRSTSETLIPDLAQEQYALGLCGVERPLEQDQDLARLNVDFGGDGMLVEAIGRKPRVDLSVAATGSSRQFNAFCRV
ncbi:hypothetical protein [Bradyrhizobium canariense]|uniref:hypothetical protein n=1 Tax=Bradyrhizobium canariense TaxID=255045 RepID=UPI001FDAC3E0|nr:hypothetical protein [Bradyrhizobium canariense]